MITTGCSSKKIVQISCLQKRTLNVPRMLNGPFLQISRSALDSDVFPCPKRFRQSFQNSPDPDHLGTGRHTPSRFEQTTGCAESGVLKVAVFWPFPGENPMIRRKSIMGQKCIVVLVHPVMWLCGSIRIRLPSRI